ncbi:MAG: hypothetical protein ACKVIG_06900 [Flavobacteriales bacterium]
MIIDNKISLENYRINKDTVFKQLSNQGSDDNDLSELKSLLHVGSKKKYLFSKNVIDTLKAISVKDDFDCNILRSRKTINGIILLNKDEFYIFNTIGENLRVLYYQVNLKEDYFDILLFTFKIEENKKIISVDIEENIWKRFLRCIIYLDFLPTEIKYIKPNGIIGSTRKDKIINKLSDEFIYVTKAWNNNYKTLPNTKFLSKAHWGIRWAGKGKNIPKLTFIKASFKEFNKIAEKETNR